VFLQWRRWLTAASSAVWRLVGRATDACTAGAVATWRFLAQGRLPVEGEPRGPLLAAGALALAIGVGVPVVAAALARRPVTLPLLAAAWTLVWACVRLLALDVAAPLSRRDVLVVWAASLLPYALAALGPLALLALPLSAWLAARALVAAGVERRIGLRIVALVYGAQVLVEVAAWLVSGTLLLLPAS
jgi:hypothetical protein